MEIIKGSDNIEDLPEHLQLKLLKAARDIRKRRAKRIESKTTSPFNEQQKIEIHERVHRIIRDWL